MVDDKKKKKKKKPPKLTIDDFKHVKLDPSWSPLQRLVRMSQEAEKLLKQEKRVNESERPMTEKEEGTSTEKPPVSGGSGIDVSRAERLTREKDRERLMMGEKMSALEVDRALKKPVEYEPHISKREKKWMMMMGEEEEGYFKKRASCGIDISKGERSRGEKHSLKKPVSCGIGLSKCERLMLREKTLKIKPLAYPVDTKRSENPLKRKRRYSPDSDDYEEEPKAVKKKTKKNIVRPDYMGPVPPPRLPREVLDRINRENGSDVKLVIQKPIYHTDLSGQHNRLLIPLSKVKEEFLTEGEVAFLGTHIGRQMNGIKALFLEPRAGDDGKCEITFKKWTMKKPNGKKASEVYVFNGDWRKVCVRNRLKEGMIVQVWSFRREDGSLGFALVIVEEGSGSGGGGGASGSGRDVGGSSSGGGGGSGSSGGYGDVGGSGSGDRGCGDSDGGGNDKRTSDSQSGDEKGGSGSDSEAKTD